MTKTPRIHDTFVPLRPFDWDDFLYGDSGKTSNFPITREQYQRSLEQGDGDAVA